MGSVRALVVAAALAFLDSETTAPTAKPKAKKVVAGRFGAPLRDRHTATLMLEGGAIPAEFLKNADTALAAKRARGGKSA